MSRLRLPLMLGIVAGVVLGGATIAQATFTRGVTASQSVSTRSLVAPTALTATPSGHNVVLGWTAGSGGSASSVASGRMPAIRVLNSAIPSPIAAEIQL